MEGTDLILVTGTDQELNTWYWWWQNYPIQHEYKLRLYPGIPKCLQANTKKQATIDCTLVLFRIAIHIPIFWAVVDRMSLISQQGHKRIVVWVYCVKQNMITILQLFSKYKIFDRFNLEKNQFEIKGDSPCLLKRYMPSFIFESLLAWKYNLYYFI
jgi:hypothetical protein